MTQPSSASDVLRAIAQHLHLQWEDCVVPVTLPKGTLKAMQLIPLSASTVLLRVHGLLTGSLPPDLLQMCHQYVRTPLDADTSPDVRAAHDRIMSRTQAFMVDTTVVTVAWTLAALHEACARML
jgi:hypothetical protein